MSDQFEALLDDAEQSIEALAEESTNEEVKSALKEIDLLLRVVNEAEDLLETVDLSELPEAIDWDELLEAIHLDDLPDALESGDHEKVLKVRHLARAVKLAELWEAVDLQHLWQEKGEFDDAVDDLTHDDDGGIIGEAIEDASGSLSDGEGNGLVDGAEEVSNEFKTGAMEAFGSAEVALEDGNLNEYQALIQQQAMDGIDEFRDALVTTHGAFDQLYDENRKKMRRTDKSTNSRNPTAVSTLPLTRNDLGSGARYSTVPRGVRYSTAPTRDRIYGRRFKRELEKRRQADED